MKVVQCDTMDDTVAQRWKTIILSVMFIDKNIETKTWEISCLQNIDLVRKYRDCYSWKRIDGEFIM